MSEEQITNEVRQPKKSTNDMTFDELKAYTKTIQDNKKKYNYKYSNKIIKR